MPKETISRELPVLSWDALPNTISRFFLGKVKLDQPQPSHHTHPWYKVLWLTGVDYFSTLGYQPGIALLAAGVLSPIATLILIVVTLCCALPVYAQVAARSYVGQGSIAMLENLLSGWKSKVFVLVLLGFAATDFVITMTLSAADAAKHAIENPFLQPYLGDHQITITLALLTLLAVVFLRGFREAIRLGVAICVPYILLNVVVLGRALYEVATHPSLWNDWQSALHARGDLSGLLLVAAILFPKLALGLSGFETGVSVMPLVADDPRPGDAVGSPADGAPVGRVRATRKMLAAAAIIMSCLLLASSISTTLLIPESAYATGGKAAGRAIAYLAHELMGSLFGSIYDFFTIIILWFAGASAMAGLMNLIPRYMPRFGMAPRWTQHARPLVLMLFGVNLLVTLIFRAKVEAQAGAYATGVLMLMLSAAIAVSLALWNDWRESRRDKAKPSLLFLCGYFWIVTAVFAFTLLDNVHERPDGVFIASAFIIAIIIFGAVSRYQRARELRVSEITLSDEESTRLWESIVGKRVNLVPLRTDTGVMRDRKASELRRYYQVRGPIAFVHVNLTDNRSEFLASLRVKVRKQDDDYVITVYGAVAIANTIAYISELIDPIALFLGLTRQNLMTQALRYLVWGEGETGLMVYTILLNYWEKTPEDDVRPLIFLMSE